jgi:hypothetical protein
LDNGSYAVLVTNVPDNVPAEEAERTLKEAVSIHSPTIPVVQLPKSGHVVTVRISEQAIDLNAVSNALASVP